MGERKINPVKNNIDKQHTYKENCAKYKKAVAGEFYFEAMLIAYAMLEDRLRSFLYHIGALERRESIRIRCGKTKEQLSQMVDAHKRRGENNSLGITSISGKIKVIRCTFEWAINTDGGYENDKYLKALKSQYEGNIDIGDVLDFFEELDEWLKYRNEVIHALLNKNTDSLNEQLAEKTQRGMELARKCDRFVVAVKKRNYIRRSINMSIEK